MKQFLTLIFIAIIGINSVKSQADSTYFSANFFAHGFFDRWDNYQPEELIRRAKVAIEKGSELAYGENGLNYRAKSEFYSELGDGQYMTLKLFEYSLNASFYGVEEGFEAIPANRDFGKYSQIIEYVPDDFTKLDGSSPFEVSTVNDTPNLGDYDDLRFNVINMKESTLTTGWDQDSMLTIFRVMHGLVCHNDGYTQHDLSNCNLHNTSAGGICFTIPTDKMDQVSERAQWRCGAYTEVYLSGLPNQISICEGISETMNFTSNGNVTVSTTGGVSAVINGSNITISGSTSGIIDVISTDGTIDTVLFHITVNILSHEEETFNPQVCDGSSFQMENGDLISTSGFHTITILNGAANGCNRTVNYNLTILPNEALDSTIIIHTGETITLPNGMVLDDTDNGETGSYIVVDGGSNGCDLTVNWTVEVVTAVIDVGKDERISVFPNPFEQTIVIDVAPSLTIEKVILLTSVGQKIYEGPFTKQVQVNGAAGMYILQLMSKDDVFVQTLVKH